MVEAATRETSARALMLITAPSQQDATAARQEKEEREEDTPCTAEASGRLSRCRFRVRMLRCEGVSQSKERSLLGGSKGDVVPAGLL